MIAANGQHSVTDRGVAVAARGWLAGSCGLLASAVLMTLSLNAVANVPVVESRGESVQRGGQQAQAQTQPQRRDSQEPAVSGGMQGGGSGIAELFHQIQLMQVEMQELRGLVEEQAYQIERLTRMQREQYQDVDRRIMELSQDTEQVRSDLSPEAGDRRPQRRMTEAEAYSQAFDLTRDRQFEDAIRAFDQLLIDFPNGQFAANAYYWLGELYLALDEPDLAASREHFEELLELYPTHQKVPDTLYKLAVVHDRNGDVERARNYLQRVQDDHDGTPAARLAESYAAELR